MLEAQLPAAWMSASASGAQDIVSGVARDGEDVAVEIASVEYEDAEGAMQALADDVVWRGNVRLHLQSEVKLKRSDVCVRLYKSAQDASSMQELSCADMKREGKGAYLASFLLPEGLYERVEFCVKSEEARPSASGSAKASASGSPSSSGNAGADKDVDEDVRAMLAFGGLLVDRTDPVVEMELASTGNVERACWYGNSEAVLKVRMHDRSLDVLHSHVAGVAVFDLLGASERGEDFVVETSESGEAAYPEDQGSQLRFSAWKCVSEDGELFVEGTLTVGEGSCELAGLVEVQDAAQNHATAELSVNKVQLDCLIVDLTAPQLSASVSREPACVHSDDELGEYAFFQGATTLAFAITDGGGVREATLEHSQGRDHKLSVQQLSSYAIGATLSLGQDPFVDSEAIVVSDLAGNVTRWSLQEWGERRCGETLTQVENAPLCVADGMQLVGSAGHPAALVADGEAPTLQLGGIDEGSYHRCDVSAQLIVRDANLGYLARFAPQTEVICVTRDDGLLYSVPLSAGTPVGDGEEYRFDLPFIAHQTHEDDGVYRIVAQCSDLAENQAQEATLSFVLDTTAPQLSVSFGDEGEPGPYYAHQRTARLSLRERHFELDELNASTSKVSVQVDARDGRTAAEVDLGAWHRDADGQGYVRDLVFPPNGTYELRVSGADKAGNLMEGDANTKVDDKGAYASGSFIIDDEPPRVSCSFAPATPKPQLLDAMSYFASPVTLSFTVQDRNFDPTQSTVTNSSGEAQGLAWTATPRDEQGQVSYQATLVYAEEAGAAGGIKLPRIVACDLAGNHAEALGPHFVVDQTAPEVRSVTTSKAPSAEGRDARDGEPFWFYNERDGQAARMSFVVGDAYGLDALWLDDPDDAYDEQLSLVRGAGEARLQLTLRDAVAEDTTHDTVFERDVTLSARDVAGNLRMWTMDRNGNIVAEHNTGAANVSIDGKGLFPHALIKDVTAPVLSIGGVQAGSYYASPQVAHLSMDEYHFSYLSLFDPERSVATVEYREGSAEGACSSWQIPVRELKGERPLYAMDQPLVQDGHYRIKGQVDDFAGNPSQEVLCEEFTIDTTAPLIQLSWDNNEARNGRYFKAHRTATVEVVEHNFDPSRMEINTTGDIGSWYSSGDVHRVEVSFARDATLESPHTLAVRGSDLAGNEATPCEEAPFVIDTQAPVVSFARRVSGADDAFGLAPELGVLESETAFSAGFEPQVTLSDEANLDPQSVKVSLVGKRPETQELVQRYRSQVPAGEDSVQVSWSNLGLEELEDGWAYRLDADDIYTLSAQVSDLAGNQSKLESVSFSLNRYGSNYFVDELEGIFAQAEEQGEVTELLAAPPELVVHEVNVCGTTPEEALAHSVTKEYASATSALECTDVLKDAGYTLRTSSEPSQRNPYEGWSEYVYTIAAGNFGQGSSSDYGDGGQGRYRVDVSSRDRAQNNNTTARYWASDVPRAQDAQDSSATVAFTLDEFGPELAFVDKPGLLEHADSYTACFRLQDEISNGDSLEVLVDGKAVDVYPMGSEQALVPGELVSEGSYCFVIPARPVWEARSLELCVGDYTKLATRQQRLSVRDFRVSSLVEEAAVAMIVLFAVALFLWLCWRQKRA